MNTLPHNPDDIEALAGYFETRPAEELLRWAAEQYEGRIVLTCSWQRQSSVLVDMLWRAGAQVRIVEIDTGLLFPETHRTRDLLVERYGVEVETIHPERTVDEQAALDGPALWNRDPDRCCEMRKVSPMESAMLGMEAWVTGIRRGQSVTRRNARSLEYDGARDLVKVQPLVGWTDEDVVGYLYRHDVPYNALHDEGYPSIGCFPCTKAVAPGGDPRSGRWAGSGKIECGLHLPVGGSIAS
ncbi:MAG: phosphoadenylyl-sulfate reductase [Miltoncostaeaceae bacterium]